MPPHEPNRDQELEELRKEVIRLRDLVYVDELTGLLNRRGLKEEISPLFDEARFEEQHPNLRQKLRIQDCAAIFIDCDNFKRVNDTYGHDVGDAVLRSVAGVLKEHVRSFDAPTRFGGEEMVVILLGANEQEAFRKAEDIRTALSQLVFPGVPSLTVTASIGVAALHSSRASSLDQLIEYADKAMYEAKHNRGKNNTVRFSELS
jgi:diguanylate cyclase (GGDEF)-like protein